MIIENGYISCKIIAGGGLDDDGYPILPSISWGEPIPCNIHANGQANVGVTTNGNVFETSAYEVLIEQQPFTAEVVKLVRDDVDLGEFQVQGKPEQLNHIDNIKILVKCLPS